MRTIPTGPDTGIHGHPHSARSVAINRGLRHTQRYVESLCAGCPGFGSRLCFRIEADG